MCMLNDLIIGLGPPLEATFFAFIFLPTGELTIALFSPKRRRRLIIRVCSYFTINCLQHQIIKITNDATILVRYIDQFSKYNRMALNKRLCYQKQEVPLAIHISISINFSLNIKKTILGGIYNRNLLLAKSIATYKSNNAQDGPR